MAPVAFDGVLVIDKPAGPTSHDIVACVRRTLGLKKVGHLGTLDPLASGVLPLVVGRATRLSSLLAGAAKQYDAVIRLGLSTDTYDITGTVVWGRDAADTDAPAATAGRRHPSPVTVAQAAADFVGSYLQRPPSFSAKKVNGVRAYDLARRRQPVEVPPAQVTVERLEVVSVDGPRVRCRLVCSSGFYVRSLAHDLGKVLGCGGCLESLRRERHGPFSLETAVPLAQVVEDVASVAAELIPMRSLLPGIPAVVVSDAGARRVAHGSSLRVADIVPNAQPPTPNTERVRVLDKRGGLLAIADRQRDGALHPKIVLV